MSTVDFYSKQLLTHESALREGSWPIQDPSGADLFLDLGVDPSMSSSGICAILRTSTQIISCKTLNFKTGAETPTPLRLGAVCEAVHGVIRELTQSLNAKHLHVTLLFEVPPNHMSSSGWLYALNQFIWLGFGPEELVFKELQARKIRVTFNQFAIGVTQLKHLYLHWCGSFQMPYTFKEISKQKSVVVAIINRIIDGVPGLRDLLPKRFNHDVAEGIILACCAGTCSRITSFTLSVEPPVYPSVDLNLLHQLLTSRKVNTHNERLGWVFRPLMHSFGWDSNSIES